MGKPIIIFGAGASRALKNVRSTHLQSGNYYPPLTNELFDERFSDVISRFSHIKERLHQIEFIVSNNKSLEGYLSDLHNDKTETSQMQLTELRFYLKELFDAINNKYFKNEFKNTSHYFQFLRDLKRFYNSACIITFNYDLFLDQALESIFQYKYDSIKSYYEDRQYELYKVHGSTNWHYLLPILGNENFDTPERRIKFIIEAIANRKKLNEPLYPSVFDRNGDYSRNFSVPALAIPLPDTKEFIVDEHKNQIINKIKQADKIIIIGWSANDDYFVKLIMDNVDLQNVKLIVIDPNSVSSIADKFIPKKESEMLVKPNKTWAIEPKILNKSFSALVSEPGELDEVFKY